MAERVKLLESLTVEVNEETESLELQVLRMIRLCEILAEVESEEVE